MTAAVNETNCCLLTVTATPSITNNEKVLLPVLLIFVLLIGGVLLCVFGYFIYRYVKKQKLERQKPVESSVSPPTLPLAMPGQINSSPVLPEQITSSPDLDHDSGSEYHMYESIHSNWPQSTGDFPVGQDDPTVLQGPEKQFDKTHRIATNARFDIEQAHGSATVISDEPKQSENMEYRFPPKRLPRDVIIYLANEMKASPQLNEVVASFYKI